MEDHFIEDLDKFLDEHGMFDTMSPLPSLSDLEDMLAELEEPEPDPEVAPPMQQEAAPEPEVQPPMQQKAAPDPEVQPPMQQEAAPDPEVAPPMQQEAAPELQAARWTPISMGVPIKQLLQELPFTANILPAKDKPRNYMFTNTFNLLLGKPNEPFPVQFTYGRLPGDEPMYVRATVVFADPTQVGKRVETCKNHYDQLKPAKGCEVLAKSVLHSFNPGPGVYQCGEPGNPESFFSVVVLATGTEILHNYVMKCRNSCFKKMAHRKTEIIFTLEDKRGNVYARQVMGVQSCSSPFRDLRDMLKKSQSGRKRAATLNTRGTRSKRRSVSSVEYETNLSRAELESTDLSPAESETIDFEPTEQHVDPQPAELRLNEPLLPEEIVNSPSVAVAYMRCLTDDIVRDYGYGDPRVLECCRCINSKLDELSELLQP